MQTFTESYLSPALITPLKVAREENLAWIACLLSFKRASSGDWLRRGQGALWHVRVPWEWLQSQKWYPEMPSAEGPGDRIVDG